MNKLQDNRPHLFWLEDEIFDMGVVNAVDAIAKEKGKAVKGASAIFVYIALCRHASRDGRCFPSIKLLAEETGLSERTVSSTISILSISGLVDVQRNIEGRKHQNNVYFINSVREVARKKGWHLQKPVASPRPEVASPRPEVVKTKPAAKVMPAVIPPIVAGTNPPPVAPAPVAPPPVAPAPVAVAHLNFPKNWDNDIRINIAKRLQKLPVDSQQKMLDRLLNAMATKDINNPVPYLEKMIQNECAMPSIPKPEPVETISIEEKVVGQTETCPMCDENHGFIRVMLKGESTTRLARCKHNEEKLIEKLRETGDRLVVEGKARKFLPGDILAQEKMDSSVASAINIPVKTVPQRSVPAPVQDTWKMVEARVAALRKTMENRA